MATVQNVFVSPQMQGRLRSFDLRRDLSAVADLVEECFNDTIDPDGKRYLRQMRSAARNPGFLRWANNVVEHTSMPLTGYIWEEDGRIVGNLSLIPFNLSGRRIYLIANVAVAPRYRRRGIARALTSAAIDHAVSRKARSAWLHVREDNEPAVKLYRSMGFRERARRTTWHSWTPASELDYRPAAGIIEPKLTRSSANGYAVGSRLAEHWPHQSTWLEHLYPPELAWHFPLDISALRPGLLGATYRFFTGHQYYHWSVQKDKRLLGSLTRQRSSTFADYLWLALPPEPDETALEVLLKHVVKQVHSRRPLTLDFPARLADTAIQAAGFHIHQVLIWMDMEFH